MRTKKMDFSPFFKNWAKPGPPLLKKWTDKKDDFNFLSLEAEETLDALCGHYRIFQLKKGHRYSTDDVLTAWYGTNGCPSARSVLDLGSGIGSVGMIAAWRLQGARFVTIEAQEISVELAKKSIHFNEIQSRYEIRQGDFRDPEVLKKYEKFDLILASPPYFPLNSGILGDHPQKIACRFEVRGNVFDYCQIASEHLERGGVAAFIFPISPEHQLQRILQAAQKAQMTIVRQRAIHLKEGDPPLLSLFLMTRSDDLPPDLPSPVWVEPPLIIRTKSGTPHPEYQTIKLSVGLPPHS